MARVVLGIGTSHSPQLSMPPEGWAAHGDQEVGNPKLDRLPPSPHTAKTLEDDLTIEAFRKRFEACQTALERIRRELHGSEADVVVIGSGAAGLRAEVLQVQGQHNAVAEHDVEPGRA